MRQAVTVLGLFLGLGLVSGCTYTDPVVQTIDGIIGQMREASKEMRTVTEKLTKVVQEAEKANKKITKKDLAPVVKDMDGLRKVGLKLVEFNTDAERYKAKLTTQQAEEMKDRFRGEVINETDTLNREYEKLKQVSEKVRNMADSQETREHFTEEFRISLQEFESLTRLK
jgi:hypothetical protein